jgi:hypothetical protein
VPSVASIKDRQAGYGRAANCKAKGYKIHALVAPDGALAAWRVAPMNTDERVMAARMLRTAPIQGYVMGDKNYDSNKLHQICDARGDLQLVTPRRNGGKHGIGHHKHAVGRHWGGGLTHLPPWVRTHRRVHRWVQAKLVLTALKPSLRIRTYAA